jgi:hypothetical protein
MLIIFIPEKLPSRQEKSSDYAGILLFYDEIAEKPDLPTCSGSPEETAGDL